MGDLQVKDLEIEFGVLKEMGKERIYVAKYKKVQNRYRELRKNFLQQKDDFDTQKDRNEAIKRPRNKGVRKTNSQEQLQRDARGKLLENVDALDKQDEQLQGINKVAHDTVDTTNQIAINLRSQREKINTAIQDTQQANQNVALGKKVINTMSRRECCYKAALHIAIILLFAAIVALGILKLYKISSK